MVSRLTNDVKVALRRGILFRFLVGYVFLPIIKSLLVTNDSSQPQFNQTRTSTTPSDTEAYQNFLAEGNYNEIESYCWYALLIITLINKTDDYLMVYRHHSLRGTGLHKVVTTVREFLMGGIVLSAITCLVFTWMHTESSSTAIFMFPCPNSFNPCPVITEVTIVSKLVLSGLSFTSLVKEFRNMFGKIIQRRSDYGFGYAEILMFLVVSSVLQVTQICRDFAEFTFYAAASFSVTVFFWNVIIVALTEISAFDRVPVNGELNISSDALDGETETQIPDETDQVGDWVKLPVAQGEEGKSLVLANKTECLSMVAVLPLSKDKDNSPSSIKLRTKHGELFTSLKQLKTKQTAPATQLQNFKREDIICLYKEIKTVFAQLDQEQPTLDLYKKHDVCVLVGSATDCSFVVRVEEAMDTPVNISGIFNDEKDVRSGPPATVHLQSEVNWADLSQFIKNLLLKPLEKYAANDNGICS